MRLRNVGGLFLAASLFGLAACGQQPQTVSAASVGVAGPAQSPAFPVEIQSAAFNATIRTGTERCSTTTFPLEGANAFDAAMREALASARPRTAPRLVRVSAEQLVARFEFTSPTIETMAHPSVLLVARMTVEPRAGRAQTTTLQWTGRSYGAAGALCAGLGPITADAYRDALRGLAAQVRERADAVR